MNMLQELNAKMSHWVTYFVAAAGEIYKTGLCNDIAGDMIEALAELRYVWDEWDGEGKEMDTGAYESWTISYQPTNCPWRVEHHMLPFVGPEGVNYLVDIPMKEYVRFEKKDKKWYVLNEIPFNVTVLRTPEDFLAAYPGMTKEEAKAEALSLQEDSDLTQHLTQDALIALSKGKYPTITQETAERAELENAGQLTLATTPTEEAIMATEKEEETTTVTANQTPITLNIINKTMAKKPRNPRFFEEVLNRAVARLEASDLDETVLARIFAKLPRTCPKCGGDGVYHQNGGRCFACIGKGFQEDKDRNRCIAHHGNSY